MRVMKYVLQSFIGCEYGWWVYVAIRDCGGVW